MEYDAVDMKIESVRDSMEGSFSEGVKKGEAIGIEKGREETARKMIKKKMDIETIIEFTGLTREKIEQLIKKEAKPKDEE